MNYSKAYYYLFNQISDMIEQLKEIQMQAEELCISFEKETSLALSLDFPISLD